LLIIIVNPLPAAQPFGDFTLSDSDRDDENPAVGFFVGYIQDKSDLFLKITGFAGRRGRKTN